MLDPINVKYFKLSIEKLKKDTSTEISCCCPLCGDTKNRLHLYTTEVGDLVHCFNEGCSLSDNHHSMYNFLKMINSQHLQEYQKETYRTKISQLKETNIQDIINSVKEVKNTKELKEVKELPLDKLFEKAVDVPEAVEYIKNRNIPMGEDWYYSKNKFFEYDGKKVYLKDYIIIPIYNNQSKYQGFYSRSIKEKTFSTFLLPGVEKIWIKNPTEQPDIICEGVFDCLSSGFDNPAAMLGASLSVEYIRSLSKNTIIALDNDPTGVRKSRMYLEQGFRVFVWTDVNTKDFNEMVQIGYTPQDIKKLIEENTYQGVMGLVKLGIKEK